MISIESLSRERVLLYSLFVSLAFFQVMSDPDYFFHLAAGAYIVEHRLLPAHDVFSFSMEGAPWVVHEWLFEVFIYGLHYLGGDPGVSLFFAALIILFLKLSISAIPTDSVNTRIVITLITLVLLSPYLAPRPQLFSFLFFSSTLFALFRWYTENNQHYLKWLPLQMIPWVNLHGGYLIGIVLILLFIGLEMARNRQQRHGIRERIGPLIITLLLTVAASLINPYFIHQWLFPFELMNMPYVQQITEWLPPDITLLRIQAYIIYLATYLFLTLYLFRRSRSLTGLLPLPFIAASLDSNRHIPFALLSMAPLFLLHISQLNQRSTLHIPSLLRFNKPFSAGKPLGKLEFRLNGVIALIITVIAVLFYSSYHINDRYRRNRIVPVMATDFIKQAGIDGRMFNSYRYGGYLLYRLYPQQRVFIDARADMYDSRIHADYKTIFFARPKWRSLVEHYRIDYFVFERNTPIAKVLSKDKDFSIVYRDSHNIIALRRIPRFADIISRFDR